MVKVHKKVFLRNSRQKITNVPSLYPSSQNPRLHLSGMICVVALESSLFTT